MFDQIEYSVNRFSNPWFPWLIFNSTYVSRVGTIIRQTNKVPLLSYTTMNDNHIFYNTELI